MPHERLWTPSSPGLRYVPFSIPQWKSLLPIRMGSILGNIPLMNFVPYLLCQDVGAAGYSMVKIKEHATKEWKVLDSVPVQMEVSEMLSFLVVDYIHTVPWDGAAYHVLLY